MGRRSCDFRVLRNGWQGHPGTIRVCLEAHTEFAVRRYRDIGFEGLILNLGNGLVKAGQVDAARVMYANARYAANYKTWPYRDVLETIAASDLNARAALYVPGANPNTAPPPLNVPNRSCVYCHATVPEPRQP